MLQQFKKNVTPTNTSPKEYPPPNTLVSSSNNNKHQ